MPTVHINDSLWTHVEKKAMKAIMQTHTAVTPQILLQWLVDHGLENMDEIEIDQRSKEPKTYRILKKDKK